MRPIRSRRLSTLLASLFVLALLAASCGDDDADTSTGAAEDDAGTDADATADDADDGEAADPADDEDTEHTETVIAHKYGETVVPHDPQRVVSVGYSDQDDLLALGVMPVGIRDWYGEQPHAVWPWAQAALGSAEPEVLPADELNFEMVAALEPDLIIGVSSGMTEEQYDLLSTIAPTVPQPGDYPDYGTPWQVRTRMIGEAVGKAEEAEALVDALDERFAQVRTDHPEFDGLSAAVAFYFEDQPGAYASADVRARIMGDLGFVTPPEYDEIAGDSFYASFSPERIELLDTDVVVWLSSEAAAEIAASPLRDGLAIASEGREIFVSSEVGGAFSFASPLSLGYLLDELVPELALAVDGDPATAVPSAVAVGAAEPGEAPADGDTVSTDGPGAAWQLVFDSSVPWEEKAPHIENAEALEASHAAYAAAGEGLGGITVEVTSESVDDTTADVVYSLLFGGAPAYSDIDGSLERVDDTWVVTEAEFCGFLASARTPCES